MKRDKHLPNHGQSNMLKCILSKGGNSLKVCTYIHNSRDAWIDEQSVIGYVK